MYLGIDLGGTKIQFAAGNAAEMFILDKLPTPESYDELLRLVEKQFFVVKGKFGLGILGIGIGVPGTFTSEKVVWVPNIPYIEDKDLAGDLEKTLGVKVYLANDAQMALAGEAWKGAAKGYTHAILMSIGTGIGGAIMVGGKLLRGRRGAAGALGWLNLAADQPGDKNHGYLEKFASGTALAEIGASAVPPLSTFEMIKRAKSGDSLCCNAMDWIGHLIGSGLASIASVLDTDIIILSGGLSEEIETFQDSMFESFKWFAAPGIEQVPIVKSAHGNLSGAYGAVRLAMVGNEMWI